MLDLLSHCPKVSEINIHYSKNKNESIRFLIPKGIAIFNVRKFGIKGLQICSLKGMGTEMHNMETMEEWISRSCDKKQRLICQFKSDMERFFLTVGG